MRTRTIRSSPGAGVRIAGGVLALAILPAPLGGQQPTPLGGEFQVNTYTFSQQYLPSVSSDADGDFVVVWHSPTALFNNIQGRRYASNGTPQSSEFQVNTYSTYQQTYPSVSSDDDGNFVVVWENEGISVQGQRYAADGSPQGGEFLVNTYTTGAQRKPSVSSAADGRFVAVWESEGSSGTDSSGYSVQGQRFASDGTPQGGEFQVNTYTTSAQRRPSVSLDASGDFVVVWQSFGGSGTDNANYSVQGQRYAADGTPQGGEFQVNTFTNNVQQYPSVSSEAAGDFVVAWESIGSSGTDNSNYSIQGQRYASDGTPQGGEFQINSYTSSFQRQPSVSSEADGDFVVVWESEGSSGTDSSAESVQGQRYASDGTPEGGEFQVNTYTTNVQRRVAVAAATDGNFVVVWHSVGSSGTDDDNFSVQGQRFGDPLVFADGFESGDTSAWSATVP